MESQPARSGRRRSKLEGLRLGPRVGPSGMPSNNTAVAAEGTAPRTITLSKGGTQERQVRLASLEIPPVYHIAQAQKVDFWRDEILKLWHMAHDLKRELLEADEKTNNALALLKTADRVATKDGHEWGWQLFTRKLLGNPDADVVNKDLLPSGLVQDLTEVAHWQYRGWEIVKTEKGRFSVSREGYQSRHNMKDLATAKDKIDAIVG